VIWVLSRGGAGALATGCSGGYVMGLFDNQRARLIRRGRPIRASIGANGSGKTALAVYDLLPSLEAGRPVLSTVRLLDYENPRLCDDNLSCDCDKSDEGRHRAAHPGYVPWVTWAQLSDFEHGEVLADEITGVASGREWSSLPGPILNMLCQLRRRDITFTWTAPSWAMADSTLKRVSQVATVCTGFMPVRGIDSSGGGRAWSNNRLFRWTTFDAMLLTDLEAGKREKLKRLAFALQWGPGHPMFDAYDTWDVVETVGKTSEGGACMSCNKPQKREYCECHSAPARSPRARRSAGWEQPPSTVEVLSLARTSSELVDQALESGQ